MVENCADTVTRTNPIDPRIAPSISPDRISRRATRHQSRTRTSPSASARITRLAACDPELPPLETIKALNAWMKSYADQHGHVYLDYYTAMLDSNGMLKAELSEDDLHPNAAGYAIMAPLAEAAIAKALHTSTASK